MPITPFDGAAHAAELAATMRSCARTLLVATTGAPAYEVETMRAAAARFIVQAEELERVPDAPGPPLQPEGVTVAVDQVRALQAVSRELLALVNALAPEPGAEVLIGSVQGLARALARRLEALASGAGSGQAAGAA